MYKNYKYIVTLNKVIALSTYAGRTVRGVAKCHPNDTFNVEFGKALAAARCNYKVAQKRHARAQHEYNKLCEELQGFNERARKITDYLKDSAEAEKEAVFAIAKLKGFLHHDT